MFGYERSARTLEFRRPEEILLDAIQRGQLPAGALARLRDRGFRPELAAIPAWVGVADRPRSAVKPTTAPTTTREQTLKPGEVWALERYRGEVDAALEISCRAVVAVCARDLLLSRAPEVRYYSEPTPSEWTSRHLAADGVPVIKGQRCRRVERSMRGYVESAALGSIWVRDDGRDKWGMLPTLAHECRHVWQWAAFGRFDERDAERFAEIWTADIWGDDGGRFRLPNNERRRWAWQRLLK